MTFGGMNNAMNKKLRREYLHREAHLFMSWIKYWSKGNYSDDITKKKVGY
jgi:hypothetical protein